MRLPRALVSIAALALSVSAVAAHDRISTKVTWDREIAPIMQARCVSCHAPGARGPMPLTTYEEVRPWARAIKEEVLTRRMPKWHVVRGYGDFSNDPSLSPFEVALIAAWVDGGVPRSAAGIPQSPPPAVVAAGTPSGGPARAVSLPCSTRTLPRGRLLGLKPMLGKGESLRLMMTGADGLEEPILWVRDFDPAFPETYWLRNPVTITRAIRLDAEFSGSCTLTFLLSGETAR